LIMETPELVAHQGYTCALRRVVQSKSFDFLFGEIDWKEHFTPDDEIGAMIPLGDRRMSRPAPLRLIDRNGVEHECIGEAFKHKYHVFILIQEVEMLTRTMVKGR